MGCDVNQPVTVYVGYDQQFSEKPTSLTSTPLAGNGVSSSDTTFDLYR